MADDGINVTDRPIDKSLEYGGGGNYQEVSHAFTGEQKERGPKPPTPEGGESAEADWSTKKEEPEVKEEKPPTPKPPTPKPPTPKPPTPAPAVEEKAPTPKPPTPKPPTPKPPTPAPAEEVKEEKAPTPKPPTPKPPTPKPPTPKPSTPAEPINIPGPPEPRPKPPTPDIVKKRREENAEGKEEEETQEEDAVVVGEVDEELAEEVDLPVAAEKAEDDNYKDENNDEKTENKEEKKDKKDKEDKPKKERKSRRKDRKERKEKKEKREGSASSHSSHSSSSSSSDSSSSRSSSRGRGTISRRAAKSAADLNPEDRARYRAIFDRKAVGDRLDLKGFKILFRLMGEVLSSTDAEKMFGHADKDDNGTICFDEFCAMYSKFSCKEQERKEEMLRSIDKLFPSSTGEPVALKKVESLLMKLQSPSLGSMQLTREKSDLNAKDVKYLVREMDTDGNGLISKEEFVNTLCQHMDM